MHLGAHFGANLLASFALHFDPALAAQDLPRFDPHFDIPDAVHLPLHFGPQPAVVAPAEQDAVKPESPATDTTTDNSDSSKAPTVK